jgi:hypothetical protein
MTDAYFLDLNWGCLCPLCLGSEQVPVENWVTGEDDSMPCPACEDGLVPHRCA